MTDCYSGKLGGMKRLVPREVVSFSPALPRTLRQRRSGALVAEFFLQRLRTLILQYVSHLLNRWASLASRANIFLTSNSDVGEASLLAEISAPH